MIVEREEDTFKYLKEMAEDIHLVSRNYNDELIGIDYYANLSILTTAELDELEQLWRHKCLTCTKEKWASRWMVVQVCLFISGAIYLAWLSGGGILGGLFGVVGTMAMIAMLDDKRVRTAKRNLMDAKRVYALIHVYHQSRMTLDEKS